MAKSHSRFPELKQQDILRFYGKFTIGDPSKCWPWQAARLPKGYGYMKINPGKRTLAAHRASYMIFTGPIPEGLIILHECDNPPCVNPNHLKLGTQLDNIRDMIQKERRSFIGEANQNAKLTNHQAQEILNRIKDGESFHSLAAEFKVCWSTVRGIAIGSRHLHLLR